MSTIYYFQGWHLFLICDTLSSGFFFLVWAWTLKLRPNLTQCGLLAWLMSTLLRSGPCSNGSMAAWFTIFDLTSNRRIVEYIRGMDMIFWFVIRIDIIKQDVVGITKVGLTEVSIVYKILNQESTICPFLLFIFHREGSRRVPHPNPQKGIRNFQRVPTISLSQASALFMLPSQDLFGLMALFP